MKSLAQCERLRQQRVKSADEEEEAEEEVEHIFYHTASSSPRASSHILLLYVIGREISRQLEHTPPSALCFTIPVLHNESVLVLKPQL